MSKKRVFLSLPMSGYADEWIRKEILSMIEKLEPDEDPVYNFNLYPREINMDLETCNSEIYFKHEKDNSRFKNLSEAIRKLGTCDAILMHPAWRTAHGCNVEWTVAKEYGIPVRYIV